MATAAKAPETEVLSPSTEIMFVGDETPQLVLIDPKKFDAFFDRVKAQTETMAVDLSTKKGRDEIRSMAAKVTKTKTAIEKAALEMTEQWRQQTKDVNAARDSIADRLADLAKETRRPLTEFEEADKARIAACTATMEGFRTKALVSLDDTADTVRDRGTEVYETAIDPDQFLDLTEKAEALKKGAVDTLFAALQRLEREEKERAELAALRAEKEQRDAADAARIAKETADREAREAAEREATEAREAEERAARQARDHAMAIMEHIRQCGLGMIGGKPYPYIILIRELEEKVPPEIDASFGDLEEPARKLLAETLERVKAAQEEQNERSRREAAEAAAAEATRAAEAAAEEKRQQEAAAARAEIDRANARAAEAELAAQAERDRAAAAEVERQAQIAAEAAEQRRREEDQAHRQSVKTSAKQAIMTCGADEETAQKIVLAIIAGEIPAVTLAF